ncbi:hypothetical protein Tco_1178242 [Tanacetum coccineum]
MKGQDNPLIPNPHPHLLNSTIKKPIIVPSSYQPKKTHKPRKAIRTTEISQSSGPINLVADEDWSQCQDTILGGAYTQTRFETASEQSNDPPLSRGYTLRSGEDSIKLLELMELYHNLWDVIVNGDLEEEPAPTGETSAPPAPKTSKQLVAKRNQERVKSILLLAILDEYLLQFHNVADAKSLWEAIKSRFGGVSLKILSRTGSSFIMCTSLGHLIS